MIPIIVFPAYTLPIPGKNMDMINANIGFANFSPQPSV